MFLISQESIFFSIICKVIIKYLAKKYEILKFNDHLLYNSIHFHNFTCMIIIIVDCDATEVQYLDG